MYDRTLTDLERDGGWVDCCLFGAGQMILDVAVDCPNVNGKW
jgi:hypothetical protein